MNPMTQYTATHTVPWDICIVRFRYYPDPRNGNLYADSRQVIWTHDQLAITKQRALKRECWSIDGIPCHLRRNGTLLIEQINYLGWFRPKKGSK